MKFTVTTPPVGLPVTPQLVSSQLILNDYDDKDYLTMLINACMQYAEDEMECSLITQTITATYYAGEPLQLRRGPVQSIVSVTDGNGVAVTNYTIEHYGFTDVILPTISIVAPVTVVYVAGYGSASNVPAKFQAAILTHVATLYENRESITEKPTFAAVHSLADFYRNNARKIGVA
jgi:uncharacterized phiE125 gp8 family phage protein